jgi:hypothetical protein
MVRVVVTGARWSGLTVSRYGINLKDLGLFVKRTRDFDPLPGELLRCLLIAEHVGRLSVEQRVFAAVLHALLNAFCIGRHFHHCVIFPTHRVSDNTRESLLARRREERTSEEKRYGLFHFVLPCFFESVPDDQPRWDDRVTLWCAMTLPIRKPF